MTSKKLDELLSAWEENYKKGLLTFWLLLILQSRETYAFEMAQLVGEASQGTVTADEKSIYRALNRFEDLKLVTSTWRDSEVGPPRRYYSLTEVGLELLQAFVQRNILLFQSKPVAQRIQAALDGTPPAQ
jgi:DNA-binding PadR family transcriptional regulator